MTCNHCCYLKLLLKRYFFTGGLQGWLVSPGTLEEQQRCTPTSAEGETSAGQVKEEQVRAMRLIDRGRARPEQEAQGRAGDRQNKILLHVLNASTFLLFKSGLLAHVVSMMHPPRSSSLPLLLRACVRAHGRRSAGARTFPSVFV